MIVTLDGPAGVGKTTLAREVAARLGIAYLDSGAMFRALAVALGEELTGSDNDLSGLLEGHDFSFGAGQELLFDTMPLSPRIREEAAGLLASKIALRQDVRAFLKREQQRLGASGSLVAEGRDMGSVVFPNAQVKFFLDAKPEIRARRRCRQLAEQGITADEERILRDILARDKQDRERSIAPLLAAPDALVVDTSERTCEEVLTYLLKRIARKEKGSPPVRTP